MPGKATSDAWRHMTPFEVVYNIADVTANTPDTTPGESGIEIDRSSLVSAYDNMVHIAILLGADITTCTVEVWMNPELDGFVDAEAWCPLYEWTPTQSTFYELTDVPLTKLKVLVTAHTNAGNPVTGANDRQITIGYSSSP